MYPKEEQKKKIEEFTDVAMELISKDEHTKELREFVEKLTPEDAFIFGQCYGNIMKLHIEEKQINLFRNKEVQNVT